MSETLREAIERLAAEWEAAADALLRVLVPQDYESAAMRGCAHDLRALLAEHPATPTEERPCGADGCWDHRADGHHYAPGFEPAEVAGEVAEGEREFLWSLLGSEPTDREAAFFRKHIAALIAKAKAEALRDAAEDFRVNAAHAWGADASWLTTGTKVANVVADWLTESADDPGPRETR